MAWAALIVAGLLEVVWAYAMKLSLGFTKPGPSAVTIVAMIISFTLLSYAMKSLPLGTAYTIWTGIGAVGAAIIGMVRFNEPRDWPRVLCIVMVVCGIAGLKILHRA